jgi:hypothetical protein
MHREDCPQDRHRLAGSAKRNPLRVQARQSDCERSIERGRNRGRATPCTNTHRRSREALVRYRRQADASSAECNREPRTDKLPRVRLDARHVGLRPRTTPKPGGDPSNRLARDGMDGRLVHLQDVLGRLGRAGRPRTDYVGASLLARLGRALHVPVAPVNRGHERYRAVNESER